MHWSEGRDVEYYHTTGKLKPASCGRYRELMRRAVIDIVGDKIEPANAACRDFVENKTPPEDIPPLIDGSNIRDTIIRGLKIKFYKPDHGWSAAIFHRASGKVVLADFGGCGRSRIGIGKREFVKRVNACCLAEVDWDAIDHKTATPGEHVALGRRARAQIVGEAVP